MAVLVSSPPWTGPLSAALGLAGGVFLMFAPSLFGYVGQPAEVSQRIVGPILAVLWLVSGWDITRSVRWWTVPFAAWLLAEPIVLSESLAASLCAAGVGAVSLVLCLIANNGSVKEQYAGGWIGLWRRTPQRPMPSSRDRAS